MTPRDLANLSPELFEWLEEAKKNRLKTRAREVCVHHFFAAIAIALAAVGAYSVVAHSLRTRTQEFGVRRAVGAQTADILKLVAFEGMRARFPKFHRIQGRTYFLAVFATTLAGLYLLWARGNDAGIMQSIALSIDGVLILAFGSLSLRSAMARRIVDHRRWSLRMFMAVSAVWFARVGLMAWMILTDGVGVDPETMEGPFITFLAFGQYLVPLSVLELYFLVDDSRNSTARIAMAAVLTLLSAALGTGVFGATFSFWLPLL